LTEEIKHKRLLIFIIIILFFVWIFGAFLQNRLEESYNGLRILGLTIGIIIFLKETANFREKQKPCQ